MRAGESGLPVRSCRQSDVRGVGPIAVQTEAHANGNVDGGDRTLGDVERVEQQQVAAMLVQAVADLHDPAIALGRGLAARDEARLLQARYRTTPPMLFGAHCQIL